MSEPSPPRVLPLFPLTGVVLLPGGMLPLHVFELRYRNMVADAQESHGHVGMIQPVVPQQDNRPPPGAGPTEPELYPVGCAGRMERVQALPDGRYLIALRGVCRFRIVEELPLERGYRRVVADYAPFAADRREREAAVDPAPVLAGLEEYVRHLPQQPLLEELRDLPGAALVNGLAMSLPFTPMEKQALVEAADIAERMRLLLELMRMAAPGDREPDEGGFTTPPAYN